MSRKITAEILSQAADDGNEEAAAMHQDFVQEEFRPELHIGQWLVIFTATFYHVGKLLQDTHEYIILEPGSVTIVDDTGPFVDFYGKGLIPQDNDMELVPTVKRIRKGIISEVNDWPFKRIPKVGAG